jgi:hypothetical protein
VFKEILYDAHEIEYWCFFGVSQRRKFMHCSWVREAMAGLRVAGLWKSDEVGRGLGGVRVNYTKR